MVKLVSAKEHNPSALARSNASLPGLSWSSKTCVVHRALRSKESLYERFPAPPIGSITSRLALSAAASFSLRLPIRAFMAIASSWPSTTRAKFAFIRLSDALIPRTSRIAFTDLAGFAPPSETMMLAATFERSTNKGLWVVIRTCVCPVSDRMMSLTWWIAPGCRWDSGSSIAMIEAPLEESRFEFFSKPSAARLFTPSPLNSMLGHL